LNVAAVADGTPVSAAIIGGAGDDLRGWTTRGRSISSSATDGEVGAAAFVDPEAAVVDTPGVAADAGRAADLADELDIAAVAYGAPVSASIVGGAVDGLARWWARRSASADSEVGTATLVCPEATLVDAPGAATDAGGAADLTDEADVAIVELATVVFPAVIGGAVDCLLTVAGLECRVCGRGRDGGGCER
jgi:hypothetical protein